MPMISKPTGGFQVRYLLELKLTVKALKETVGCFCVVTSHLTRDYVALVRVLRACEGERNEWDFS